MDRKVELEIKLLEAKIHKLENDNSNWSKFLNATVPLIQALLISIAASCVFSYFINNFYDNKVKKVEDDVNKLKIEKNDIEASIDELNLTSEELITKNKRLRGEGTLLYPRVNFEARLLKEQRGSSVILTSDLPEISYIAYDMCIEPFVFPGELPDFYECEEIEITCSGEPSNKQCKLPARSNLTNEPTGYWVVGEAGINKTVKFIYLPPGHH